MADDDKIHLEHTTEHEERARNGAVDAGAQEPTRKIPSRLRRITTYVLYGIGGLVGLILLIVLAVLLAVQTDWGHEKVKHFAVGQLNGFLDGAALHVDRLGGNIFRGLALYDVTLVKTNGERLAHVDTLTAGYRLLPLLRRQLKLTDVYLARPRLWMTQQADSSWDLFNIIPPDTATVVDTTQGMQIELGHLNLHDGSATTTFYAPERDSVLRVEDLNIRLGEMTFGERLSLHIDTVFARVFPPGRADEAVHLAAGGSFDEGRLDLAGLALNSPHSHVTGHGLLAMPSETTDPDRDLDFTLRAAPLAFRDLHPFVPVLDPDGTLTLDVHVTEAASAVRARVDARLADGGRLELTAITSPPGEAAAAYKATGKLRDFDPAALTGNAAQAGRINADFDVDLHGPALDQADGHADLVVFDTRYGTYAPDRTTLESTFTDGEGRINLQTGLRGMTLTLNGTVHPFAPEPRYDLDGHLAHLDISRFARDGTQHSDIATHISLEGQGLDPQTASLTARLDLDPSRINQYRIRDGRLTVNLRNGDLDFSTRVNLPEGLIAARGDATLGDEIRYRIARGEVRDLNVAALSGDTTRSAVNGTFALEGRGTDPQTMRLNARLDLHDTYYGTYTLADADLRADLHGGRLALTGNTDFGEGGTLALTASAQPFDAAPTYVVQEGTFTGLNLGALTGNPNLPTSLNGTLHLEGTGTDPKTMALDAGLRFDRSTIRGTVLQEGHTTAALHDSRARFDTHLNIAEGAVQLQGTADFTGEEPRYEAQGNVQNLNFAATDTLDTRLSLTIDVEGRGLAPQTMQLRGNVQSYQAAYGDVRLDTLDTRFHLAEGVVHVDTLLLHSNVADARAGGRIALFDTLGTQPSDFSFDADVTSLHPVRAFIGADLFSLHDARLHATIQGPSNRLQVAATTEVNSLIYNDLRLAGFEGSVDATLDADRSLARATLQTDLNYLSTASMKVRRTHLESTYDGDEAGFVVETMLDERREGRLSGRIDPRPESRRVLIEDLGMRFDKDQWTLAQPVTIRYGDGYHVSNLSLSSGTQHIEIEGIIDPNSTQDFHVNLDSLRLGGFADLLGYDHLGGTLNTQLDLTGAAQNPHLEGTVAFDVRNNGDLLGDIRLDLGYDDRRLNLDAMLTHREGSTLSITGYLPFDLSLAPDTTAATGAAEGVAVATAEAEGDVDLQVKSDAFAIDILRPFLDPETVSRLEGDLSTDIHIGGTMNAPDLNGTFRLDRGRARANALGLTYDDIQATGTLRDNNIVLDHAELHAGDGTLTAEGRIEMPELTLGHFEINLNLDDFRAIASEQYQATVSGNLDVSGTTESPVVSGDLDLHNTDIYLGQMAGGDIREVELTEKDARMLEEYFGYRVSKGDTTTSSMYEALTLDLNVSMERDTWIRQTANPEITIELTGRLDVQKQPNEDLRLFRSVEVIPQRSFIRQFGRRFSLTEGTINFNGPASELVMDFTAQYEVRSRDNPGQPEVVILLTLNGRLDDLEFKLSSDPPMENTDIVSYIATGEPSGSALSFGGGGGQGGNGLLTTGGALAANQLAGIVENVASEELGLDVIEITQDGLRGTQLVAGKYVSPKIYVGINQSISLSSTENTPATSSPTEVTVEYEVFEWLLLQLLSGTSTSSVQINLMGKYAFN